MKNKKANNNPFPGDKTEVKLSRDLGLFSITMIGVGAMIGAGIFVLTGIAAGSAGPALILSFALNGIVTVFTAMVYAELGSAIPEAGGGYLWVKEGLPGPNAFQAGWMSWFAHAVAGSLYALGFGAYLKLVLSEFHISFGGLEGELLQKVLAVIIILAFIGINFKGVSETGTAGNVVTILKIMILIIFVISGLWAIFRHPEFFSKFENFAPEAWPGIISAMGLTFIAFEGYEIIVQAGEEVVNPRENIPKAVFLSLIIVVPIYIFVAFVSIGAVTPDSNIPTYQWLAKHAELGIAEAARQFMPFGTLLLLIGGLFSTMSALNATTFSSTRVSFAMGRDNNLPRAFAAINKWTLTPHKALMFSGTLILFMAVAIPIEDVAAAADIMFLLLFLQVNIAVITIRKKFGDRLKYGYLMPFFPIVPLIGIVTKLFLALFMFNYSPLAWYFAIGWIGSGTLIYYVYAKPRSQNQVPTPLISQEIHTFRDTKGLFKILVPIANPESLKKLLIPAVNEAKRRKGVILLLNVIVVPEQAPLSTGKRYLDEKRELISKALKMVSDSDVPAESLIKISHRPSQAIINTVIERNVDLLIMGWRGKSRSKHTKVGRNIDHIMQDVNCEMLVVQQNEEPPFHWILIPLRDPGQLSSVMEKAQMFKSRRPQKIKIIHIFHPKTKERERTEIIEALQKKAARFEEMNPEFSGRITTEGIVHSNAIKGIAEAAEGFDAVIIGASRESFWRKWLFGNKSRLIAQEVKPPVILSRPRCAVLSHGISRMFDYLRGGYKKINLELEKKLEEDGMLAPRGKKGTADLHTRVNKTSLLLSGLMALISVLFMYLGKGRLLTWAGTALFFISLIWFTLLSVRGTKLRKLGKK